MSNARTPTTRCPLRPLSRFPVVAVERPVPQPQNTIPEDPLMLKRLSLAAVLALLPALALAQGPLPNAALCDGSDMRHAGQMRTVGRTLIGATALADLAAILTIPRSPAGAEKAGGHFRVVAVTAPVALAALFVAGRASPGDHFWQGIVARLKVGETRSAEVRSCLQRPQARTSTGSEERWTYVWSRPSAPGGPRDHSLRLTFRDSVLAEVLTADVEHSAASGAGLDSADVRAHRHRGYCMPPIPIVADPFATPTDTTAAAAAMARAQADADAAMKNAAAAAAYATCMASDSGR